MTATIEMPRYRCHKIVHALEIKHIDYAPAPEGEGVGGADLFFERPYGGIVAPASMFTRYRAVPGDFYVVYDDLYASISPREAFLKGYTLLSDGPREEPGLECEGLSFGNAIEALKKGYRVYRAGWNGKGMWLGYTPGSVVPRTAVRPGHALCSLAAEMPERDGFVIGGHIDMRAADGTLVVGWLASQTDMLAEDWCICGPLPEPAAS